MTTLALAHKEGHARMVRALEQYAATHTQERTTPVTTALPPVHRVTGHAGRWVIEGPAHVLTDDQVFEHPTLIVLHLLVDPEHVIVAEATDVTAVDLTSTTEAVA